MVSRERNTYWILISDFPDQKKIMQTSLPGLQSVGIDVFENGKMIGNYTYYTIEECLDDVSNVTWIFFSPKGHWEKEKIIHYTEIWYGKSIFGLNMTQIAFHNEFSYVHHPELIDMTPLQTTFRIIQETVPKGYESLEKAIEITNDLNRDMNLGEPVVTKNGILADKLTECRALLGRIAVEIDMHLDRLEDLEGVKMPDRGIKYPKYNQIFNETAKKIYRRITGRKCPKTLKVM